MTPLDYHASSQDQDAELQGILKNGSALRLERVHITGTDVILYYDTSTPQPRPFITTPFRRQVYNTLHGLSHSGANATVKLVSQWFLWPGVGKDCPAWTRACTPCQRSTVNAAREDPSREFQPPAGSFFSCAYRTGRAAACLVWLPVLSGIDRYTHWPEALPLSEITAASVAKAFVSVWLLVSTVPSKSNRPGQAFRGPPFQESGYHHRILSYPDYGMASRLQWHN